MKSFVYFILSIFKYFFHIIIFYTDKNKDILLSELIFYKDKLSCPYRGFLCLVWIMECYPEYLSLFYYRAHSPFVKVLKKIIKGQSNLYIQVPNYNIGKNFMIWHGFSTIINCNEIGDDCSIWQQVTIGNKLDNGEAKPIIGNNVKICAGSIVIGDIKIGDNVVIGAGSVVTKSIPDNCIVGGVPAKIIKRIDL